MLGREMREQNKMFRVSIMTGMASSSKRLFGAYKYAINST
jgi:hypothetical protein